MANLKIEIETESKETTLELLKKVVAEITLGPTHQLSGECIEDNFLVVDGPFKGKYNWSLD